MPLCLLAFEKWTFVIQFLIQSLNVDLIMHIILPFIHSLLVSVPLSTRFSCPLGPDFVCRWWVTEFTLSNSKSSSCACSSNDFAMIDAFKLATRPMLPIKSDSNAQHKKRGLLNLISSDQALWGSRLGKNFEITFLCAKLCPLDQSISGTH